MRGYAITLVLALSITVNVLQALRIKSAEEHARIRGTVYSPILGKTVSEIQVENLQGRPMTLRLAGAHKPTLIYVFRPSCVWCNSNSRPFNALASRVAGQYNVIGLSLESERLFGFLTAHSMSIPIYTALKPPSLSGYQLGFTPETLIVSEYGTILQDWRGAYAGETKDLLEQFFGFKILDVTDD